MRICFGMNLLRRFGIGFVRPKEAKNRGVKHLEKRRELRKRLGAGVVTHKRTQNAPHGRAPDGFENSLGAGRSYIFPGWMVTVARRIPRLVKSSLRLASGFAVRLWWKGYGAQRFWWVPSGAARRSALA